LNRKVFKNGPSFVITLPTQWVKEYGISEGTEVNVNASGNTLSINSNLTKELDTVVIDTLGIDRTFLRCSIRNAYKRGYKSIKVNYDQSTLTHYRLNQEVSIPKIIKQEIESLIGFEIVEQNNNSTLIQGFTEEKREDFDIFLRKIFLKLIQRSEDLKNINKQILEEWETSPWIIKKFISYCTRILNTKGHKDSVQYFHLLSSLDIILTIIHFTGRYVKEQKITYSDQTKEIITDIINIFNLFYDFFYNYSNEKIVEISLARNKLEEKILKTSPTLPTKEVIFIEKFYQSVEIFYRLIETRMDLELK